jgi:hypothetical protein
MIVKQQFLLYFLFPLAPLVMTSDRLAHLSQRMASVTLWFIVLILVLNAATWWLPQLGSIDGGYGLDFALTSTAISQVGANLATFPWWQNLGGTVLSSVPLLALSIGLYHLRALFQGYGRQEYFSAAAATHLGVAGQSVAVWVGLNLVCEPLLSMWLTLRASAGHHLATVTLGSSDIVALFLAACITVIARILRQASEVHAENQSFV